ncbi:MAG: hypothetical protein ACE5GS_00040 [Kiloniellaceae bacterium]
MALSRRVIETLLDLVEIKLSCIEVHDREDSREVACLERCRCELQGLLEPGAVVAFAEPAKRRTRAAH